MGSIIKGVERFRRGGIRFFYFWSWEMKIKRGGIFFQGVSYNYGRQNNRDRSRFEGVLFFKYWVRYILRYLFEI